jgi:hypothetical protein
MIMNNTANVEFPPYISECNLNLVIDLSAQLLGIVVTSDYSTHHNIVHIYHISSIRGRLALEH